MIDYSSVIKLVRNGLTKAEAKNIDKINLSMQFALDDLATRMESVALLRRYSYSVSAGDREVSLTGENSDLKKVLYIKAGSGEKEVLLEPMGLKVFLQECDNDEATAGLPTKFAVTYASNGFPVIKFNIPFDADNTLTVYYFAEAEPADVGAFRSKSIIAAGTLAYFYGTTSEKGLPHYINYRSLIKSTRASDNFRAKSESSFVASQHDKNLSEIAKNFSNRRS